jgi:hypothetical protein
MYGRSLKAKLPLEDILAKIHLPEGVRVLAADLIEIPVTLLRLQLLMTKERKIGLLEEFILKAAMELNPPPNCHELAVNLGLDEVFVNNECWHLAKNSALAGERLPEIVITEAGKGYYGSGIINDQEKIVITAEYEPTAGEFFAFLSSEETGETSDKFTPTEVWKYAKRDLSEINLDFLQKQPLFTGKFSTIKKLLNQKCIGVKNYRLLVILLYDTVVNELRFQVLQPETEKFYREFEEALHDSLEKYKRKQVKKENCLAWEFFSLLDVAEEEWLEQLIFPELAQEQFISLPAGQQDQAKEEVQEKPEPASVLWGRLPYLTEAVLAEEIRQEISSVDEALVNFKQNETLDDFVLSRMGKCLEALLKNCINSLPNPEEVAAEIIKGQDKDLQQIGRRLGVLIPYKMRSLDAKSINKILSGQEWSVRRLTMFLVFEAYYFGKSVFAKALKQYKGLVEDIEQVFEYRSKYAAHYYDEAGKINKERLVTSALNSFCHIINAITYQLVPKNEEKKVVRGAPG